MKYFKFWAKEEFQINIDGNIENIKILSGSNTSKQAAIQEAKLKSKLIEQRISERKVKEEYDVAIKEHVTKIIDDSNIVTVCRYGALILNTTQYTILDLDDYPYDFMDIFKSFKGMSKKDRIIYKFTQRLKRNPALGDDFRIYETAKGIRVIGKTYIDPNTKNFMPLMRKLSVDWIYIQLSIKQKCYRARLTPKPYRIKARTIKIKDPLVCESQNYLEWSESYKKKSKNYSVVKLKKTIGNDFSNEIIIRFHDEVCNLRGDEILA